MVTEAELMVLRKVAAAWGVNPATACWAILHDRLSHWRRIAPQYGKAGIAIAGALELLRRSETKELGPGSDGIDP